MTTFRGYAEGIQNVQDFMEDDDVEFQGSLPDCVDLGELRVLHDLDLGLFRRNDNTTSLVIGTATFSRPVTTSPWIAAKEVSISGGALAGPRFLVNRGKEYVAEYNSRAPNGVPKYWADHSEGTLCVGPPPDATYSVNIRYLSRPTRLGDGTGGTADTNWLTETVPDLLFYAVLAEAEKFLKDDERPAVWEADYNSRLPLIRKELYNQFGNQYDMLGSTPQAAAPRSVL